VSDYSEKMVKRKTENKKTLANKYTEKLQPC